MLDIGNNGMRRGLVEVGDIGKISIQGRRYRAIQSELTGIGFHPKLRLLQLRPGEVCWCRTTNIPRLITNGWRAIVNTDGGDWAVFTDETRQLVLMSKRTLHASLQPATG